VNSGKLGECRNEEFYSNCAAYFLALRKRGTTDDGFEDEFYYTMPAISANTEIAKV
jgi:hypothetical protein